MGLLTCHNSLRNYHLQGDIPILNGDGGVGFRCCRPTTITYHPKNPTLSLSHAVEVATKNQH